MGANESGVLEKVAGSTQSELILFFIILAVVLVVLVIPLYTLLLKDRKHKNELENSRQENYLKRESRIIEVITANTEIMAGLKATLEQNGVAVNSSFARIDERMDSQGARMAGISADIVQVKSTLERSISNQLEMMEDIRKTLLIVDSIPNSSYFSTGGNAK